MTHVDLLQLRRHVRRTEKVRPTAALLFAEICDFYELPEGCKVSNQGFAQRLGCTARSVRNWLSELESCGLISRTEEGGNRYLEPRIPSWIDLNTEDSGRKIRSTEEGSFQDGSKFRKDASTDRKSRSEEGGKFVPTQRDNIPAEARERARAHENDDSDADVPHHLTDSPPCTMEGAIEKGSMIGVSEKLCKEWWLHYDQKGWPFEVKSITSALRKWKMNDEKFDFGSDGGSHANSTEKDPTKAREGPNGKVLRPTPPRVN